MWVSRGDANQKTTSKYLIEHCHEPHYPLISQPKISSTTAWEWFQRSGSNVNFIMAPGLYISLPIKCPPSPLLCSHTVPFFWRQRSQHAVSKSVCLALSSARRQVYVSIVSFVFPWIISLNSSGVPILIWDIHHLTCSTDVCVLMYVLFLCIVVNNCWKYTWVNCWLLFSSKFQSYPCRCRGAWWMHSSWPCFFF